MASKRPLKKGEGGATQSDEAKRARFPTPDEMDILDNLLSSGGEQQATVSRASWRKMRQLANRMKYEHRSGIEHPAWVTSIVGESDSPNPHGVEVDPVTREEFALLVHPPHGMTWAGFGSTWDLAPLPDEHGNYEPISRHQSLSAQWATLMGQQAEPLEI